MKKAIAAVIAACAICCIPLFIPFLAGGAAFGLTLLGRPVTLEAVLCGLVAAELISALAILVLKTNRRRKPSGCGNETCDASGGCGCKTD